MELSYKKQDGILKLICENNIVADIVGLNVESADEIIDVLERFIFTTYNKENKNQKIHIENIIDDNQIIGISCEIFQNNIIKNYIEIEFEDYL